VLDLVDQVVQHEIAFRGPQRQHRMAFAVGFADHGDQHIGRREAALDQHVPLEQHIIFAVAGHVGIGPDLFLAEQFQIGFRHHREIDCAVDLT
jgi:hypothetical protein